MANTSLLPHKLLACDWRSSLVGGAWGLFFWSSYFFTSRKNKRKKFVYLSKKENDRNNGIIVCGEANEVAVCRSTETAACFSASDTVASHVFNRRRCKMVGTVNMSFVRPASWRHGGTTGSQNSRANLRLLISRIITTNVHGYDYTAIWHHNDFSHTKFCV